MSAAMIATQTTTPAAQMAGVATVTNASLMQIEERLQMLLDSEEFIDPAAPDADHLRAMLHAEIANTVTAELAKVDGIANYLAWLENQQEFADQELKRLQARKAKFARRQERIEEMVIGLLQTRQKPRLEGHTTFLALRGCPPSLEITDESAVPTEYKTAVITSEMKIDKALIKRCLKAEIEVPGVVLHTGKQRLVRG
jgi:hypothetical protein